jgi:hypothetical protein
MAGQRTLAAEVPAASARPAATGHHGGPARPPPPTSAPFPSSTGGQQGSSAPPFPQPFTPAAPRGLQQLQPPSRQPGLPAYIPGYPQQFQPPPFQQVPVYQQPLPYYAPPMFGQPSGQQVSGAPPFQPVVVQNAPGPSQNKRNKKKNSGAASSQGEPPPQAPFVPPQGVFIPPAAGVGGAVTPTPVLQQDSVSQPMGVPVVAEVTQAKPGKCWKCSVDTHATKDCKVQHYCLVCDTSSHPTLRCPTLKLPKPQAFVGGPACEESLCMRLPDSVYQAHLAPKGLPTAFIKISGGSASAIAIQNLMARICPLSTQWKWEAISHGEDSTW